MSRLAQLGVFSLVVGGVVLFLGLFPTAVDADRTPGIGLAQIAAMLTGLTLLIGGAFVFEYATWGRGRPRTLRHVIGLRMGLTGLVFAVATAMADIWGFGSHPLGQQVIFGWLQATGMLIGFGVAALGVLIYGIGP
jgi:hypothetical protein